MKKIVSFVLILVMLASMLVITVNAKTPYGTVVEVPYSDKAPSMEAALPDASWGEPLIHVDKNTVNAAITLYKLAGKVKQDLSVDMYGVWTEDTLYLCFTSPDPDFRGGLRFWWGDGIQMVIYPGIADVSYCNTVDCGWHTKDEFELWDWCITFDVDDESPCASAVADGNSSIYGDEASNTLVVKFAISTYDAGFSKNDKFKENDIFSFVLNRIDGSDEDPNDGEYYVGWLEWGNFHDTSKTWAPDDPTQFTKWIDNAKTTTANTIKLVGKPNGSSTTTTPAEEPSSWARDEVNKAIAAGLVPENLQKNYTKGISRENLSKILSRLLDKVYGNNPTEQTAAFTDTTDADVLKAANLGIINGYKDSDGTYSFKPANTLKRSEMSAIVNRVANLCGKTTTGFESEVKFADTVNHWCRSELGWPVHVGIIKGTSDTTFSPENTLTTEQTIMMIYRAYEALR